MYMYKYTHDTYSHIYCINLWRDYIQKLKHSYQVYEGFSLFFLVILLFYLLTFIMYKMLNALVSVSEALKSFFPKDLNILKTSVSKIQLWLKLKFSNFIIYFS